MKKNHTHTKGEQHWPGATRWEHVRKLREFEIPNTLFELAGAEQRNFHLNIRHYFSSTALFSFLSSFLPAFFPFFFFLFFFFFFHLLYLVFLSLVFVLSILSVRLYRLHGHTLFYPLPWGLFTLWELFGHVDAWQPFFLFISFFFLSCFPYPSLFSSLHFLFSLFSSLLLYLLLQSSVYIYIHFLGAGCYPSLGEDMTMRQYTSFVIA